MSSKKSGLHLRPWLWLPSKLAHDVAPLFLPLLAKFSKKFDKEWNSFKWRGLHFKNPIGIAGGVDKTGQSLAAWSQLGAGFLEVGTVTPERQGPNSGKIMARDCAREALWNKMGFPNPGADALVERLKTFNKNGTPLFVNIGKNRWTKNEQAHLDYSKCIEKLHPYADAFVVNLSSPNTEGLRDLLKDSELADFLAQVKEEASRHCPGKPILLKLSPDMDAKTLTMALERSLPLVDGWILTNTTKQREPGSPFPLEAGGVSGRPLTELSLEALRLASTVKKQNPEKLLISVGGIGSEIEIKKRLQMGADLVQVYSALIFSGPGFFRSTITQLRSY